MAPAEQPGAFRRTLTTAIVLALFAGAVWLVHRILGEYRWADVVAHLGTLSPGSIAMAGLLTIASYALLLLYDVLALRYVGAKVPGGTVVTASFAANAIGHSVGLTALSGGSIRYRVYSAAGLTPAQIAQVVGFCTLTFVLGTALLLGASLLMESPHAAAVLHLPAPVVLAGGVLLVGLVLAYAGLNLRATPSLTLFGRALRLPGAKISFAQIVVSAVDLALTAAVLYVLLPADLPVSFGAFLGFYLIALAAGVISSVPGGLGVFESVLLLLLPGVPPDRALSALIVYRAIYYLLPFLAALVLVTAHEAWLYRGRVMRGMAWVRAWARAITPQALAIAVFICGVVLLFSGATPAADDRLHVLRHLVPLSLMELSHLLGSAAGVALLLLARGLQQRMDAAWHVTVFLLAAGIAASLLKGFDYEEASLLAAILAVLYLSKDRFTRRASLLEQRFSYPWLLAIVLAVAASVWLSWLSFGSTTYSDTLWWQFAFHANVPRVLRAGVLVIVLTGAFATWRLMRAAPPDLPLPDAGAMERARATIAKSGETTANLALLGDKKLLFAPGDQGFVMFQPVGKSWVAMGDPVGPPAVREQLVWEFREECDRYAAWPVFYQVSADNLPIYIDAGLSLSKLGEEARVELANFGLEGPKRADLRQAHRRALREHASFEMLPKEQVPANLARLREISDEWLDSKGVAEKGFSLGRFDDAYLSNFPCAVVRIDGQIVAFANLWPSANFGEISVDLMRNANAASSNLMDYLFIEVMLWGKQNGYRWFNLGMAPLAGMQDREFAPVWNRMGAFLYRHGEHFYNFSGLRRYKQKFAPEWRPRYLACPGGLTLPRVLMDVTTLIAGGTRKVLMR